MPKNLWLHGLVAAAIGGASSALSVLLASPSNIRFDPASLHRDLATAAAGALVAVLAYFKQSPIAPSSAR